MADIGMTDPGRERGLEGLMAAIIISATPEVKA
jgi:hypothetical protein